MDQFSIIGMHQRKPQIICGGEVTRSQPEQFKVMIGPILFPCQDIPVPNTVIGGADSQLEPFLTLT